MNLSGKTAIVTGASRGIGQQIALGLAQHGCNIVLHARELSNLSRTRELLEKLNIEIYEVAGELDTEESVVKLIQDIKELPSEIDILYNNAAIMEEYNSDFLSHTWKTWKSTMAVNVYATYTLCSAFLPHMLKNNYGRIVNLTSGIMHTPELLPYSASKWAVRKLSEDLACKYDSCDIKIFALDPGWLRTDMGSQSAPNAVEDVLPGALSPVMNPEKFVNGMVINALPRID